MFKIFHDNGQPIKLIGNTVDHRVIQSCISRRCEIVSFEHVQDQSQAWVDDHQFFCTAGNIQFTIMVDQTLNKKFENLNWVSMVHESSDVLVDVAKNCWISYGVFVEPGTIINDHVRLCLHTGFHENNVLESFVHVSPYSLISSSHLSKGTWIGMRSWLERCHTESYTIITMNSRIHDTDLTAGTYCSSRKINDLNSSNSNPHKIDVK